MVGFDVDAVGNEWAFATVDCRESFFDSLLILSEILYFKASTLPARTAKHPAFFGAQKKQKTNFQLFLLSKNPSVCGKFRNSTIIHRCWPELTILRNMATKSQNINFQSEIHAQSTTNARWTIMRLNGPNNICKSVRCERQHFRSESS